MEGARKYSLLEAKSRLEALCAYQERCSWELEQKMLKWEVDYEDRNRLLAHLIEHNFLNEERFAEAYTSGKINIKRWGRIKIRIELKRKFISDYSIRKALDGIDLDVYSSNLEKLATHKFESLRSENDSFKKRIKLLRYLSGKGYENDLINDRLNVLFGFAEEE